VLLVELQRECSNTVRDFTFQEVLLAKPLNIITWPFIARSLLIVLRQHFKAVEVVHVFNAPATEREVRFFLSDPVDFVYISDCTNVRHTCLRLVIMTVFCSESLCSVRLLGSALSILFAGRLIHRMTACYMTAHVLHSPALSCILSVSSLSAACSTVLQSAVLYYAVLGCPVLLCPFHLNILVTCLYYTQLHLSQHLLVDQ
jgi:hypothetical protein